MIVVRDGREERGVQQHDRDGERPVAEPADESAVTPRSAEDRAGLVEDVLFDIQARRALQVGRRFHQLRGDERGDRRGYRVDAQGAGTSSSRQAGQAGPGLHPARHPVQDRLTQPALLGSHDGQRQDLGPLLVALELLAPLTAIPAG
ncbi:hypothetical protein [Pseudonocardia nigra]|uniref:hypothetical protein n=1 Tax=Pseudonocardia nigra TaxID=1921578 RepID=UPI001C5FE796|nr:hypothetical protein [Pseudonocardia nigra]